MKRGVVVRIETLHVSPRAMATWLVRQCATHPVVAAADLHVRSIGQAFKRPILRAKKRVRLAELIDVLKMGHPGTGAPLYVLEPILLQMQEEMTENARDPYPAHRTYIRTLKRRTAAEKKLSQAIHDTLAAGGSVGGPVGPINFRFDAKHPESIAWAEHHAAELVTQIGDDTRDAIRLIVVRGFDEGTPPRPLARLIREGIGLTERDAGAVMNRRAELIEADDPDAEEKALAYEDKLLNRRAETIARTESIRAAHEGQQMRWEQAIENGLLTGDEEKVWIASEDACDICLDLDGQTVPILAEFPDGDPPRHPNCRCSTGIAE